MNISDKLITLENFRRTMMSSTTFNPDYQRELVWPESNKEELILSLLDGMHLPTFWLYEKNTNEWEVVDGKQRLTTLLDFAFGTNIAGKNISIIKNNKRIFFRDLSEDDKSLIKGTQLQIKIITGTDAEARKVFIRLQKGVKLTPLDIRHAIGGDLCKNLVDVIASEKISKIFGGNGTGKRKWEGEFSILYKIINDFYELPPPKNVSEDMRKFRWSHKDAALEELYYYYVDNEINKHVWNKFKWMLKKVNKGTESIKRVPSAKSFMAIRGAFYTILKLEEEYDCINKESWDHLFRIMFDEAAAVIEDFNNDRLDKNYHAQVKNIFGYDPYIEKFDSIWISNFKKGADNFCEYFKNKFLKENRIELKRGLDGLYSDDKVKQQIIDKCGLKCSHCGIELQIGLEEYDHIISRKNGGKSTVSNGQILCKTCNTQKGSK